ncbi:hypothetical protein IV102_12765 [bacterium]|nr:hypothetical protein [bacterium]
MDEWLRSAVAQGKLHSQGSFSLDTGAAARKFGQYALTDSWQIVARLLRSAVLCAPSVQLEVTKTRTQVSIPGFVSGVANLKSVFDQVLSSVPEEREFSLAVNSLVADHCKELTITRGEPSRIALLKVGQDRRVEVAEAFDLIQTENFTRIEWTEVGRRTLDKDLERLRQGFRYSRIPINLNGEKLDIPFGRPRGPGLWKHLGAARQILVKPSWFQPSTYFWADHHAVEFRLYHPQAIRNEVGLATPGLASCRLWAGQSGPEQSCFLALACRCDPERPGQVDWVYRGQCVDSQPERFAQPGLQAVVACEGLPFDVTGERLIEGPARAARLQLVRDWANCLHDFLCERYPNSGDLAAHRALYDSKLRAYPQLLPQTRRVVELLQRLSP